MRSAIFSLGAMLCIGLLAGCSHEKPVQTIDNGALVRLSEGQMQPVDDARVEEGRARDNVARAAAGVQEAKAKIEIAKAERDVATAQQKRTQAELEMLQKQKADATDIDRAKQDLTIAQQRVQAVDFKLDYLSRSVGISQGEQRVAEQHAQVAAAAVEKAKFGALHAADPNQVRDINVGVIDQRLAEAQSREAQLRKDVADQRVELVESYNKWQDLDAKVRTAPPPAQPRRPDLPAEPITH
jgi:hypothetical protein